MHKPASQPASQPAEEQFDLLGAIIDATEQAPQAPALDPLAEARKLLAEAEARAKAAEARLKAAEAREKAAKPRKRPVVAKPAKPAPKGEEPIGSATYKGRRYNVMWCGTTRAGRRMFKLAFKSDPSQTFWVAAHKVRDPKIKPSTGLTCPGNNNCRVFGWPKGRNCC